MGELANWAKKTSKFVNLEDNEPLHATYQGFKIVNDSRDPEKEKVVYRLGIVIDGQQIVKAFETAAGKVARFFDTVAIGAWVSITRHGMLGDTSYDCEAIPGLGEPPVA